MKHTPVDGSERPAEDPSCNWVSEVEAVLIEAPPFAAEVIYGKPLLERLLLVCMRAGVKRFFIEASGAERGRLIASLGSLELSPDIVFVDFAAGVLDYLHADALCMAMRGNLVLSPFVLREVIARQAERPGKVVVVQSTDDAHGGNVASRFARNSNAVFP